MEKSTYFSDTLAVTGSEVSDSHKNTYNIDLGIVVGGSRKRYAPFTCIVKHVNLTYNTITCESVDKVISPKYPNGEYLCFSVGHLSTMTHYVGKVIKQGELLGEDGLKGTTQVHTHWSFGVGKLKMPNFLVQRGTYNKNTGIYALACTVGWIHSYDFWFLSDKTKVTTSKDNPGVLYPWKRFTTKKVKVVGELIKQEGDIFTIKGVIEDEGK